LPRHDALPISPQPACSPPPAPPAPAPVPTRSTPARPHPRPPPSSVPPCAVPPLVAMRASRSVMPPDSAQPKVIHTFSESPSITGIADIREPGDDVLTAPFGAGPLIRSRISCDESSVITPRRRGVHFSPTIVGSAISPHRVKVTSALCDDGRNEVLGCGHGRRGGRSGRYRPWRSPRACPHR